MKSIKKLTEGLESIIYALRYDYIRDGIRAVEDLTDAIKLLKKQDSEIQELRTENSRLNNRLRIMYNRCICFRGADSCSDCAQREECESKRNFYHNSYLRNRERVRKEDTHDDH